MCIWSELSKKTINKTCGGKGKGYFVKVPTYHVFLDDISNNELLSFTNLPTYIINYNFLLSQKMLMQIIHKGGTVKLHSEEWMHKSSGRGKIELIVDDNNGSKTYYYSYWFPHTVYTDVFPRLFPWANFSADNDFYEEFDMTLWRDAQCHYDKEDNEWIVVGDSFEQFRKSLEPMRSIIHSGEVAEFMFKLSLNKLGKSFLNIDEYISQPRHYTNARPNEE